MLGVCLPWPMHYTEFAYPCLMLPFKLVQGSWILNANPVEFTWLVPVHQK
jgi:hypothetical protein